MKKTVKFLHSKSVLVLLVVVFALTFASCRLGYTVKNARFANEFVGVYTEHSFDFKENKSGTINGSFRLPRCVDPRGLRLEVMFPAMFRNSDWDGIVGEMSYELVFEWEGGGRFEKKGDNIRGSWYGVNFYLTDDERKSLPLKETITYTFTYSGAEYTLEPFPSEEAQNKLKDLQNNPDKYPDLYEAVFVVAEKSTKKMPK